MALHAFYVDIFLMEKTNTLDTLGNLLVISLMVVIRGVHVAENREKFFYALTIRFVRI